MSSEYKTVSSSHPIMKLVFRASLYANQHMDRFFEKVEVMPSGCWEWQGSKNHGYGRVRVGNYLSQAHRVSYETAKGLVPADLELDHLCRNRSCVNPDHLEAVTHSENMIRSPLLNKPTCPKGHPRTPDNLYVSIRKNGKVQRDCKMCRALKHKREYNKNETLPHIRAK